MSRDFPWNVLELSCDATQRDIKRAYARLAKVYRPDQHPKKFGELRNAYEVALAHNAQVLAESSPTDSTEKSNTVVDRAIVNQPTPQAVDTEQHDSSQMAAWQELQGRIEETLHEFDATADSSVATQGLLDDVCAFVRHPATVSLWVAEATEAAVLDWGARYELPTAVTRFIWNHYELETRIAFEAGFGPINQFDHRVKLREHWQGIMDHVLAQPTSSLAQLFRPMSATEKFTYYTNFSVRSQLRSDLEYLQQRFPDRAEAMDGSSVAFVERSVANSLPRLSLEAIAVVLVTIIATYAVQNARSSLNITIAHPVIACAIAVFGGYALTAAYNIYGKPILEKIVRDYPTGSIWTELLIALVTLIGFSWWHDGGWAGVLVMTVLAASYALLVDAQGGYFQQFWGGSDPSATLATSVVSLAIGSALAWWLIPNAFVEAVALTGTVIVGLTSVAAPLTWSALHEGLTTRTGLRVSPKRTIQIVVSAVSILLVALIAQIALGPSVADRSNLTQTVTGVLVIAVMAVVGWPASPLVSSATPLSTGARFLPFVAIIGLATMRHVALPQNFSFVMAAGMVVRLLSIAWLLRPAKSNAVMR